MLIIFGGLPATGKTTLAKLLSKQLNAVYLRIDTIEHSLQQNQPIITDMRDTGYQIAYALAVENLKLGRWVIADSVNPLTITRKAWRAVAENINTAFIEIEIVCSNKTEHQKRITERLSDITEFTLPSWSEVTNRNYEPWLGEHLVIDTATLNTNQAISIIMEKISID